MSSGDFFAPLPDPGRRQPGARGGRSAARGLLALVVAVLVLLVLVGWRARDPLPLHPTMYDDGTYRFLSVQAYDADVPVTYNHCQQLHVVMNPLGAPPEAEDVLQVALDDLHRATGFDLRYDGPSIERPYLGRRSGPILVTWTDESEMPSLTDDVAGRGGSSYTAFSGERAWYATGQVYLSANYFERLHQAGDVSRMRAVLDHEFGHVLGLDHVEDGDELMHPSGRRLQFGHGDLTGLAILGTQPC